MTLTKTRFLSFARALHELANEKNNCHKIYQQSLKIIKLVSELPEISRFFCSPVINRNHKTALINQVFGKFFDPLLCDFLKVVVDMHEFHSIIAILRKFLLLVEQVQHVRYVKITSAIPLTAEQLTKIKTILEKKLASHLVIKTKVDPSVIAGVRVETESKSFDSTIVGKLKNMKVNLLLEKIQGKTNLNGN